MRERRCQWGGAELAKTGTKGTEINGKGNKGSGADPSGKRRGRRSIGGSQDLTPICGHAQETKSIAVGSLDFMHAAMGSSLSGMGFQKPESP